MEPFVSPERVEAVSRYLCRDNGYDPDKEWILMPSRGEPLRVGDMYAFDPAWGFPLPMWRAFEPSARQVLQAAHEVDAS